MGDRAGPDLEAVYAYDLEGSDVEALLDESLHPMGPDSLFDLVARLGLGPGDHALDVGCRTGGQAVELARRFRVRVLGVDPVRRHVHEGNAAVRRLAAAEPEIAALVSLAQGVAEALPAADGSMSLVWCRDVLVHVADLERAFGECRRVLAPGGTMVVFQMLATPDLHDDEAAALWAPLAVVPDSTDPARFERAIRAAGLEVTSRVEVTSQWREFLEEDGTRRTSRQLLRAARMRRDPGRYVARLGRAAYQAELANCLWGVYTMIGKLSPRVYALRRPPV